MYFLGYPFTPFLFFTIYSLSRDKIYIHIVSNSGYPGRKYMTEKQVKSSLEIQVCPSWLTTAEALCVSVLVILHYKVTLM